MDYKQRVMNDIESLTSLSDEKLGRGYLTEQHLKNAVASGGPLFLTIAYNDISTDVESTRLIRSSLKSGHDDVLVEGDRLLSGQPLGFMIGQVSTSTKETHKWFNLNGDELPHNLQIINENVGFINNICLSSVIDPNTILVDLISDALRVFHANSCKYACIIIRGDTVVDGLKHELLRNGFEPMQAYENYWSEQSRVRRFSCGVCGSPPCTCDGYLYVKTLY